MIINKNIDSGKPFDFGKTSEDYALFRDIYPESFYSEIAERGLCVKGQKVLDLGTGTGVLPRNMYKYGAKWTATDISVKQIEQAKRISAENNMDIDFLAVSTEEICFNENSFDVITACQCFWYFDQQKIAPVLSKILKKDGRLLVLYMAWLPFEDKIANMSENLVLKYSPNWSGGRETVKPIAISDEILRYFEPVFNKEYKISIPFTRESWHGRMRACRGIGASLTEDELQCFDREHMELLKKYAPDKFEILHYVAMAELKKIN